MDYIYNGLIGSVLNFLC